MKSQTIRLNKPQAIFAYGRVGYMERSYFIRIGHIYYHTPEREGAWMEEGKNFYGFIRTLQINLPNHSWQQLKSALKNLKADLKRFLTFRSF